MISKILRSLVVALLFLPAAALAALPAVQASVRYMALGDSLAAGYKAMPATAGYVYQLYLGRAYGSIPDTVFANAAVPGATSTDVLTFQMPQVPRFQPNVVTISAGGNDLLALLGPTPPTQEQIIATIQAFAANMQQILAGLCIGMPAGGQVYVQNLYEIPDIPETRLAVPAFNQALADVVRGTALLFPPCANKTLAVADVYNAFLGQQGLLLIDRYQKKGIDVVEVHPTNKGHRVIEGTFRALIGR